MLTSHFIVAIYLENGEKECSFQIPSLTSVFRTSEFYINSVAAVHRQINCLARSGLGFDPGLCREL